MKVNEAVAQMKNAFKRRYNYLTDVQVEDLYRSSLGLYLSLSFPFDRSITEIPEDYIRDVEIIRRIMVETIERDGLSSVTAYSENGMSFTFDNAHISKSLLRLIIPKAKGVKRD